MEAASALQVYDFFKQEVQPKAAKYFFLTSDPVLLDTSVPSQTFKIEQHWVPTVLGFEIPGELLVLLVWVQILTLVRRKGTVSNPSPWRLYSASFRLR